VAHFGTKRHKVAQKSTNRPKVAHFGPKVILLAAAVCLACRSAVPWMACDSARLTAGKSQRLPIKHDIRPTSCGCCRLRAVLGWHGSHSARFSGSLWGVTVSRRLRLWLQCRWLADESSCLIGILGVSVGSCGLCWVGSSHRTSSKLGTSASILERTEFSGFALNSAALRATFRNFP
jgi:hypothetical protein